MVLKKQLIASIGRITIGSFSLNEVFRRIGTFDISSKFYTEIAVLIFAALFLPFMALIKRKFGTYSGILFLCIYGGIVFSWVKNH